MRQWLRVHEGRRRRVSPGTEGGVRNNLPSISAIQGKQKKSYLSSQTLLWMALFARGCRGCIGWFLFPGGLFILLRSSFSIFAFKLDGSTAGFESRIGVLFLFLLLVLFYLLQNGFDWLQRSMRESPPRKVSLRPGFFTFRSIGRSCM